MLAALPEFRLSKILFFCTLAVPLALLFYWVSVELSAPTEGLGLDPEDAIVDHLGEWSIRFLWLTLLISSMSRVINRPVLVQFRRMAGLWAFTMVVLHFMSYLGLFAKFDVSVILDDFTERPYIIAGLVGLLTLLPLAITSTRGWRRRLRHNWNRLHKLVYVAAIAGWIHLLWLEKATFEESAFYGAILLVLFAERIFNSVKKRRRLTQTHISRSG